MDDTKAPDLPPMPLAYEYVYGWSGGHRSLSSNRWNGMEPDTSETVYTRDQMHAYLLADRSSRSVAEDREPPSFFPAGFAWVPVEPTAAMIVAAGDTPGMKAIDASCTTMQLRGYPLDSEAFKDGTPIAQAWRAMLAAAPKVEAPAVAPRDPHAHWIRSADGLSSRNPAPDASQAGVPNSVTVAMTYGAPAVAPSEALQDALAQERAKFQQETRRTSMMAAVLRGFVEKLKPEHEVGAWSRGCDLCTLVSEADALLKRPINAAAAPAVAEYRGGVAVPMSLADENIGRWLSASLDDPKACDEFKADVRAWFDSRMDALATPQPSPAKEPKAAQQAVAERHQPTNVEDAAHGNVNAIRHVAYGEGWRDGKAAALAQQAVSEPQVHEDTVLLDWLENRSHRGVGDGMNPRAVRLDFFHAWLGMHATTLPLPTLREAIRAAIAASPSSAGGA